MGNPVEEAQIEYDGNVYTVKYGNNAQIEMEKEVGMSIQEIVENLSEGQLSKTFVRGLIWAGLKGGGQPIPKKQVGIMLDELKAQNRVQNVLKKCMEAFAMAVSDDDKAKKEIQKHQNKGDSPTQTG